MNHVLRSLTTRMAELTKHRENMVSCLEVPGVPQSLTLVSTPSTTPPPPASSGHHLVLSLEPPAPRCCRSIKSQSKLHLLGETFPNGFAKSPPELCPYILSPQHFPLYGLISSVSCLLREHCDARSPLQRPACLVCLPGPGA